MEKQGRSNSLITDLEVQISFQLKLIDALKIPELERKRLPPWTVAKPIKVVVVSIRPEALGKKNVSLYFASPENCTDIHTICPKIFPEIYTKMLEIVKEQDKSFS